MLASLLATVLVVVYVVVLGLIVRWLLGARVGLGRTVLTGAVGFFVILPATFLAVGETGGVDAEALAQGSFLPGDVLAVLVSALWALALCAAFVAGWEFLRPSYRRKGLLARLRGGRDRLRRTVRYLQIVRVAMRHGLGPLLHGAADAWRTSGHRSWAR
ncbi:hypothetical protein [Microbacterium sp.]|uniref:hypothetical protein n=1 Tax=Microbacterium sp. TaxID=51671 RepID=UPI0028119C88|nr:hypothetical protein [Microbacterium sp.]